MENLLARLQRGEALLIDGGMGTLLQTAGLRPGQCPELWCIERGEEVKKIHRDYRQAGSQIVETNSFGGTCYKLREFGLAERVGELNRAAVELAREVAGDSQYVLASAGPTGQMLEPYGDAEPEDIYAAYLEQMQAFAQAGADAVIIETMFDIEEARQALLAAQQAGGLITIASFTFDAKRDGSGYVTMMGATPAKVALEMHSLGVDIVGSNCGLGGDHMIPIIREMRQAVADIPLLAMPNAGLPVLVNGQTVFQETPEVSASFIPELRKAGANLFGGCCGTTPAHIKALAQALHC